MIAKSGARVVFEPDADEAGRVMTASRRLVTYYLSRDRVLGLVQVDQLPAHVLAALLGQDVLMASAILSNAIGQYLLIRPQEVSTCRVFNLGITEEAFYALR